MSSEYEEDVNSYDDTFSDNDSIIYSDTDDSLHCMNDNVIMLEPYTKEDDPIEIYTLNSKNIYEKSICITLEELKEYLENGKMKDETPSNIVMSIYTKPPQNNVTGEDSEATGKIVIKIPPNNIYFTYGSIKRIFKESNITKKWYAEALFEGKRRRVGNLSSIFGQSMNHGQIPGYKIDRKSTRLNSSHIQKSRMPSSA